MIELVIVSAIVKTGAKSNKYYYGQCMQDVKILSSETKKSAVFPENENMAIIS